MDVPALLRQARERSVVSRQQLARASGASVAQICRYEQGQVSPTVATLDRLVMHCGFQLRVTLEPYRAELDAWADQLMTQAPELEVSALRSLQRALEDQPRSRSGLPRGAGPCQWAFDGTTAMALHGYGVRDHVPEIVLVWDDPGQRWAWAYDVRTGLKRGSWFEADAELAARWFGQSAVGQCGMVTVRIADRLPPVLRVHVDGLDEPVPTVAIDEVEAAHLHYADVLAVIRERRGQIG